MAGEGRRRVARYAAGAHITGGLAALGTGLAAEGATSAGLSLVMGHAAAGSAMGAVGSGLLSVGAVLSSPVALGTVAAAGAAYGLHRVHEGRKIQQANARKGAATRAANAATSGGSTDSKHPRDKAGKFARK
jgi:hypothetical protein